MPPTLSWRRHRAALLFAGISLVAAACTQEAGQPQGANAAQLKPREATRVRVAPVQQREMVRRLETTTVVESENEIKIYPRIAGTVVMLIAEEGLRVEMGDLLAKLDDREAQAKLAEARVALQEAEDNAKKLRLGIEEAEARVRSTKLSMEHKGREYDRNARAEGVVSELALDQLRLARDTAIGDHENAKLAWERSKLEAATVSTSQEKAKLAKERAELELSYTQITAPFSGVIASRSVRRGDAVNSGTVMFVLTEINSLRAVFYRPQREFPVFTGEGKDLAGIELTARAEALPNARFIGRVQRVSPSIDADSGNFRVTVRLEPATQEDAIRPLLPGMLVRLSIVSERHPDALVVEKRALRREGEVNLLFVVDGSKVRRVEVQEGFSEDQLVEVLPLHGAKLAAGDQVVVVGNRDLEDGAEIALEGAAAPR